MSLLFPAYLLGFLGLLLPWILHRFSNQQPEEQLFPSTQFLEATKPPTSRTKTLKHRLLLLLRSLSILLLCFLFAQPLIDQLTPDGAAEQHHIVAIDRSLSMRAGNRWANAVDKAGELIADLEATQSVELVAFDSAVNVVASNEEDASFLSRGLSGLEPGYGRADYGSVMQKLNQLASEQAKPVKLWVISDQQQSSIPSQKNALFAPEVDEFEIVSMVSETDSNLHIRVQANSENGATVSARVTLNRSHSVAEPGESDSTLAAMQEHTLRIHSDDELLMQRRVSFSQGDSQTIVVDDLPMPNDDFPVLNVSVAESDSLMADNQVSVVVQQKRTIPFALLHTDSVGTDSSTVFLSTALETSRASVVTQLSENASDIEPLVLHLVTGRDLSSNNTDTDLRLFIETGRNALVFSKPSTSTTQQYTVGSSQVGLVDQSHPISLGGIDWFGVDFYDVKPMTLLESDRVLIETSTRQPILVERETEQGRLLLLNDPLDGQSSNLPLQPAFVQLMEAIVSYFDTSTALPSRMPVGGRLMVSGNVQVLNPDDEPLVQLGQDSQSRGVVFEEPGIFKLIDVRGTHLIDVQLDPQEADLTPLSNTALANWTQRFDNTKVENRSEQNSDSASLKEQVADVASRSVMWRWLLPMLVLVFLAEKILANRRLDVRRDGS